MKKINYIILLLLLNTGYIYAQSIYFNKRIDITNEDWDLFTSILTQGKEYLVVGDCGPTRHIFLSKLDSIGNIKWTNLYDEAGFTYYMGWSGALFQSKDNYYAFCGMRVGGPKGYGTLIKVDSSGNKKWEKEYQLLNNDNAFYSGNITRDSGYILTGDAHVGSLGYSYLLLKTDSLGNQQWYKTFTDNDPNRNYAGKSVIQTPDKGYCLGGMGGYNNSPNYYSIAEIIKTDSLGIQQWKKLMVIL